MNNDAIVLAGVAAHNKAIDQITTLSKFVKLGDQSFDIEKSLEAFDLMMQGFMLKIAISDDFLDATEIAYIKVICDKADILKTISTIINGDVNLDWTSLKFLDKNLLKKLINIIEDMSKSIVKKFILPYVAVEMVFKKDVLAILKKSITDIIVAFTMVDGDSNNIYEKISTIEVLKYFEDEWNSVLNLVKESNKNQNTDTEAKFSKQNNSLKSKYESLKKN